MIKLFTSLLLSLYLYSLPIDKAGYTVGDKAIDFNLKNVDGTIISMGANTGNKGYIVIFTCNTCPYSVAYEDRIIALHNKFASLGYPVIAINSNDQSKSPGDSFKEMVSLAKDKNYPFPYSPTVSSTSF